MECGVFVILVILELVLANCELIKLFKCELLFMDFYDNYYILLFLICDWYIVSWWEL